MSSHLKRAADVDHGFARFDPNDDAVRKVRALEVSRPQSRGGLALLLILFDVCIFLVDPASGDADTTAFAVAALLVGAGTVLWVAAEVIHPLLLQRRRVPRRADPR